MQDTCVCKIRFHKIKKVALYRHSANIEKKYHRTSYEGLSALKVKRTTSGESGRRIVRPGYLDTFVVIKFDDKHRAALYDLELTIRQHG